MKIRTDFVTNSSSSSFTLWISVELKNGEQMEFCGTGDCEGIEDYYQLASVKSPKELCSCKDVNELIEMLKNTVVTNGIYGEGFPEEGFTDDRCYERVLSDDSDFIREIRERVGSMADIKRIFIQGEEEGSGFDDYQCRRFTFDNTTKEYIYYEDGCKFGCEGRGGAIEFADKKEITRTADSLDE